MYSESKVRWRLEQAERELGTHIEYHAVGDVIAFDDHLKRAGMFTYDSAGRPDGVTNLTEFERAWMLNEQTLVMCDAAYFLTRYAFLKSEENVIQRFEFRVPQKIYFDIISDLESRDAPIEIMILKARQLGMSIFTELLISHRIIFSYGVTSVIGSADSTKTQEMSKMLLLCYDMLPVWLRPQYTSRVESERGKLLFGQMASGVSFQHGSQKFGIATGSTPTIYHLSEVALYGDAAVMLIDEGLWKAVHASTNVFGALESTGRSNKGWWADTWYYSKNNWPRCRMYPMFLPWFCGVDIYPKPAWMRLRPIPAEWRPNKSTREHVAKAQLYVRSQPLLEKYLVAYQLEHGLLHPSGQWRMPLEQQWFWEVNHEEAKRKNLESSFLQEMAGDDEEALQRSTESVFGFEVIEQLDTARKPSYELYGLSGQSIEEDHEPHPDYIDYNRDRIATRFVSPQGESYRWEIIPIKHDPLIREDVDDDVNGMLVVWHHPRPGVSYSVGVDTSQGIGLDSMVIEVYSCGSRDNPDVQCAEFSSNTINHVEAFAFILAICSYYGRFMEIGVTRWAQPYVSIEQIAAVGDTAQLQMAKMGYRNFHKMVRYDRKNVNKSASNARGWFTNGWSRPILTTNFVHAVQNGWIVINSPWLIEEMKHFETVLTASGKQKMQHEEDFNDDRIFGSGMATFCPHDLDLIALRSKKRTINQSILPPIDMGPARGLTISSRTNEKSNTIDLADVLYQDAGLERFR